MWEIGFAAIVRAMKPELLPLLMCPVSRGGLTLTDAKTDKRGHITEGWLVSERDDACRYPIVNGVPRFIPQEQQPKQASVSSFGDQWNFFNFDQFKTCFEIHGVKHTFGNLDFLKGKTIVDAGAGSGMQTRWMAEAGAKHVIGLELSHAVDGIIAENLEGLDNVDIIQCSIDAIPLKDGAIPDVVMCYNVIQHTPNVEKTAKELWRITGKKGEFCWNCYTRNDSSFAQRARFKVYSGVRAVVGRLPFALRLGYSHLMAVLRLFPVFGSFLEKADLMRRGEIPGNFKGWARVKQGYRLSVLNTFDYFGAHAYQAHHTFEELQGIVQRLGPDATPTNGEAFYTRPQPIGIMLRVKRGN